MVSSEEGEIREDVVVREDEEGGSPSSPSLVGAYTALFESVSSDPSKGDDHDALLPPKSASTKEKEEEIKDQKMEKEEEIKDEKLEEPFFCCIEPVIKKLEENLHNEFVYVDKLQSLCIFLQDENKSLKDEIEDMKDFIFSTTLNQDRKEVDLLHDKVQTLEAALRVEILKANEYKKELHNARHVLARRTRAKVKKVQLFEVILAQKPQDVALASCATPFHDDDTNIGSCPICLDDFDIASGWYTLNCKHRYHLVCLAKVMPTRTRCCVCNQELHKLLYEIFGMAHRYPNDARLWDAQTGQPVDFTLEEDIRAIMDEIEESSQEAGQADNEEEIGTRDEESEENLLMQDQYSGEENSDANGEGVANSQFEEHNDQSSSQVEDNLEEEGGDGGTTDEDRERNSEEEGSSVTSEEEDDPDDLDYTPSQ